MTSDKNPFFGTILAVQPRIRMLRSFDQRNHSYQGYVLRIDDGAPRDGGGVVVAVGEAAQKKHSFRRGDVVSGAGEPPEDDRTEVAVLYKVSKLKVLQRQEEVAATLGPPWHGVPPDLETYRERGHRRLDVRVFKSKCTSCIWGCEMAVEMTIDHWKPSNVRWRYETFCYGPKSCKLYRSGPTRKVPGRNGMSWEEEDWIDEQDTAHRDDDE